MRRGRITTDEELLLLGEGGEEAEDEGEEQAGAAEDSTAREIKWASLPDGMKVLPSPEKLDDSLVSTSSSTFAGSRRTVGHWAPSLTRLPLRRRVSSRSSMSRSSNIDGSIGPGQPPSRQLRFRPDCAVQLVVPVGEG